MKCRYCNQTDHETAEACPRVSLIEYTYDGRIRVVKFFPPRVMVSSRRYNIDPVKGALSEAG